MIKSLTYKYRAWLLLIFFICTAFMIEVLALRYFSNKQYQRIVGSDEIRQVFYDGNIDSRRDVSIKYGLEYQEIKKDEIVFTTPNNFSVPKIIPVDNNFNRDVIMNDKKNDLEQIRPTVFFLKRTPYIAFFLPSKGLGSKSGASIFLIYKSIF